MRRADSLSPSGLADANPRGDGLVCACTHYLVFKEPTVCAPVAPSPRKRRAGAFRRPQSGEPFEVTRTIQPCQCPFRGRPGGARERRNDGSETLELEDFALGPALKNSSRCVGRPKNLLNPSRSLAALAADIALRTSSEYRVRFARRQVNDVSFYSVSFTTWFSFAPFRSTSRRPSIASARRTRACGSATRRLFT